MRSPLERALLPFVFFALSPVTCRGGALSVRSSDESAIKATAPQLPSQQFSKNNLASRQGTCFRANRAGREGARRGGATPRLGLLCEIRVYAPRDRVVLAPLAHGCQRSKRRQRRRSGPPVVATRHSRVSQPHGDKQDRTSCPRAGCGTACPVCKDDGEADALGAHGLPSFQNREALRLRLGKRP